LVRDIKDNKKGEKEARKLYDDLGGNNKKLKA
jgi:hypothetical protein